MTVLASRVAAVQLLGLASWAVIGADLTDTEEQQVRAAMTRWYWSGPNRGERQVLRRHRIRQARFGLGAPSALDGRHRIRQRNRRRRK